MWLSRCEILFILLQTMVEIYWNWSENAIPTVSGKNPKNPREFKKCYISLIFSMKMEIKQTNRQCTYPWKQQHESIVRSNCNKLFPVVTFFTTYKANNQFILYSSKLTDNWKLCYSVNTYLNGEKVVFNKSILGVPLGSLGPILTNFDNFTLPAH